MLFWFFIMAENLSNIEWCIYDLRHGDYNFSLNKETLNKIENWENVEMVLHHYPDNDSVENIQERMRKTLILGLLSDKDRREKMTNALVTHHTKESKRVTINISKELIQALSEFKWNHFFSGYEYRYNIGWDKMIFYVEDSFDKECLRDNIDFYNQLFDKRFPKK